MTLLAGQAAYAQSDEQILEKVRTKAVKIYLEQASWTLPESFHSSGLAPSDKARLVQQWANASANCLADSLATYAKASDVPLSDMVSDDGSFGLKGDGPSSEFYASLNSCIELAWEAVGTSPP